jgi:transposase
LSELLRRGALRAVCHGSPERAALKELARTYQNRVEDGTRVMLRLKALFRARGIKTPGRRVYDVAAHAEWLAQLSERGVWFRATALYAELEVLQALRPQAKTAMLTEAKRDPAWGVLRTIPFLGPVRVALLVATLQTPWRFRTKRHLWAYAGLAVVTRASAEYALDAGRPSRRRRAPMTRGLNRNYNRVLKDVLKGAATAAATRAGPLQDLYHGMLMRGMREELARVTLTRKLAALTLHLWKTGEHYDPTKLTMPAVPARVRETVSTSAFTRRPVRRGPRRTIGPPAEPEKASGRLRRVSDRTMVRSARPKRLHGSNRSWSHREENDAEDRTADDSAISRTPISLARSRIGADCHGQTGQTLSRHEVRT